MPIAAIIAFLQAFIPQAVALGAELAPLIASAKTVFNDFATAQGATQADFDSFHSLIAPYEQDLQARADAAATEAASGAVTS